MLKSESIADIERGGFCPEIFENPEDASPVLKENVRKEILDQTKYFENFGKINIIQILGSMLTKQYTEDSDVDITLIIDFNNEEDFRKAKDLSISTANKNMLTGTKHPINIFVREDSVPELWDNIFDVVDNKWVKQTDIPKGEVVKYKNQFRKIASKIDIKKGWLTRDIIDYNQLLQLPVEELKKFTPQIEEKLKKIDLQVKQLAYFYDVIAKLRAAIFKKTYNPVALENIKSRNLLPANIIYKLLEKYHYTQFLKTVKKALEQSGGEIDKPLDVELVRQSVEDSVYARLVAGEITVEEALDEMTTAAMAGPYNGVPWPSAVKKMKKKKKKVFKIREY